jgi:hypothetical protein
MAAHAIPLARVSRIAIRLKVFATLFIALLPPLYRIRLLSALWRVLLGCKFIAIGLLLYAQWRIIIQHHKK